MTCCDTNFSVVTDRHFNRRIAQRELDGYRKKGPGATTRMLRDGLRETGPLCGQLLDIGAGMGQLTFELLGLGVKRAVAVDVSEAFVEAGREESKRRGHDGAVVWYQGDFVGRAPGLPPAAIVALNRVVCCYPDYQSLLAPAVEHAEHFLAISYPKDRWYVRAVIAMENFGRRIMGKHFRTWVHPAAAMEGMIEQGGFRLVSRRGNTVWCADIYAKASTN